VGERGGWVGLGCSACLWKDGLSPGHRESSCCCPEATVSKLRLKCACKWQRVLDDKGDSF
jgi:hypothetical protein